MIVFLSSPPPSSVSSGMRSLFESVIRLYYGRYTVHAVCGGVLGVQQTCRSCSVCVIRGVLRILLASCRD